MSICLPREYCLVAREQLVSYLERKVKSVTPTPSIVSYTKSLSAASNPPSVDCFSAPATELLEMVEDLYNKCYFVQK